MSEQAAVPFFGDGPAEVALPHEAARPAVGERGRDWSLAAVILGSVAVSYAVVIGAIYVGLTALL